MFSESFKINVNKNCSSEKVISLVRVTHPSLLMPICLIDDSEKIIFQDEEYIPFPMRISINNQSEGELPSSTIDIPNISKQITKAIDEALGVYGGLVEIIITRRSSLIKEYSIKFNINSVSIDSKKISFNIAIQNILFKESIRWKFDKDHAVSLF